MFDAWCLLSDSGAFIFNYYFGLFVYVGIGLGWIVVVLFCDVELIELGDFGFCFGGFWCLLVCGNFGFWGVEFLGFFRVWVLMVFLFCG